MPAKMEEAEKLYREKRHRGKITLKWKKERDKWRSLGPVVFAENFLKCPPDVPDHPDYGRVPDYLVLSDDQKELLNTIWKRLSNAIILSAGRGAGKTFIWAVWDTWALCCLDDYKITFMGGSQEQSSLCQDYIDFWRDMHPFVMYCLPKSTKGVKPKIRTRFRGRLRFSACSKASARGPHVNMLQLDEVCTAEDKSEEGAKAVDAAWWQTTGKRDTMMVMSSTTDYIHGKFMEILQEPEKWGFKRFVWSIVKHKSGEPVEKKYKDKNPDNWIPNYWWITKDDIERLRKKSDEEWLCEALGRPSMASGAVFSQKDLELIFCELCKEECEPYKRGKCHLVDRLKLGDDENPTKFIIDRRAGYDYGDKAPNALVIGGMKGDFVFVLWAGELKGTTTKELLDWIDLNCKDYGVNVVIPDPSVGGRVLSNALEELGYAVYLLGNTEGDKMERLWNVRTWVERHRIIIPKAFWNLTRSLKKLAWGKKGSERQGKLRKVDDHSYDALSYLMNDWQIGEGAAFELWDMLVGKKKMEQATKKKKIKGVKFDW